MDVYPRYVDPERFAWVAPLYDPYFDLPVMVTMEETRDAAINAYDGVFQCIFTFKSDEDHYYQCKGEYCRRWDFDIEGQEYEFISMPSRDPFTIYEDVVYVKCKRVFPSEKIIKFFRS